MNSDSIPTDDINTLDALTLAEFSGWSKNIKNKGAPPPLYQASMTFTPQILDIVNNALDKVGGGLDVFVPQ
jgi:hypothetical protein